MNRSRPYVVFVLSNDWEALLQGKCVERYGRER